MSSELIASILRAAEFKPLCGYICGAESEATRLAPLIALLAECVNALEKCGSPEPLIGYAFDANHQHGSLIEEMVLRRGAAQETLTKLQAYLGEAK